MKCCFYLFALFLLTSCNASSQKMCVQVKARFENENATQAEKEFTLERLRLRIESAKIKPDVTFSQGVITVKLPCAMPNPIAETFRAEPFAMYETYDQNEVWEALEALDEKQALGAIDRNDAGSACIGTCPASVALRMLDFLNSGPIKKQLPSEMSFYAGKPDPKHFSVAIFALRKTEKPPISAMMIKKAGISSSGYGGDYYDATLEFEKAHAKTLAGFTERNAGRAIAMLLGDQVVSCPVVPGKIDGGKVNISALFSKSEAENLAKRINLSTPLKILIFEESVIN